MKKVFSLVLLVAVSFLTFSCDNDNDDDIAVINATSDIIDLGNGEYDISLNITEKEGEHVRINLGYIVGENGSKLDDTTIEIADTFLNDSEVAAINNFFIVSEDSASFKLIIKDDYIDQVNKIYFFLDNPESSNVSSESFYITMDL